MARIGYFMLSLFKELNKTYTITSKAIGRLSWSNIFKFALEF